MSPDWLMTTGLLGRGRASPLLSYPRAAVRWRHAAETPGSKRRGPPGSPKVAGRPAPASSDGGPFGHGAFLTGDVSLVVTVVVCVCFRSTFVGMPPISMVR